MRLTNQTATQQQKQQEFIKVSSQNFQNIHWPKLHEDCILFKQIPHQNNSKTFYNHIIKGPKYKSRKQHPVVRYLQLSLIFTSLIYLHLIYFKIIPIVFTTIINMKESSNSISKFLGFFRSNTMVPKSEEASSLSTKTTFQRREASDVSQFQGYLSGIPFDIRRMRNKKQSKSVTLNSVKMELLEKCYRNIPVSYFDEDERLDFGMFFRSKRKTQQSQEKINQYLDQVQVCLFNQVTSRFDQFVAVLRTIEALDLLVKDNLTKVNTMKTISQRTQRNMLKKSQIILNLQKQKKNRQEVLQRMMLIKKALSSKDDIRNDISINMEGCLSLIDHLKSNKSKVNSLKCAINYDKWVQECQQVIKRDFTQNFSEQLYKYITMNANYDRSFWEQLALRKDLLIQVEDLNNTTVLFDDQLEPQHKRMVGVQLSPEIQDKIVQIVVNGWSTGQLGVAASKSALDQHFIQQFQNLLSDIRQFSYQRLMEVGEGSFDRFNMQSLLEHMSIQFYGRVLEYYSLMIKRYLRRLFSVSTKCVSKILQISVTAQHSQIERLQSVLESIFNIQLFVVKSSLQKFIKLVNIKKIGTNVDFFRFRSYLTVLEAWENYFNNEVALLFSQIKVPTQSQLKERFYILKNKLNSRYITQSKNQLVAAFFNNLHRYIINQELKNSLQQDSWQVVDIPTSFYQPIGVLLSGESWAPKKRNQNNTLQSSLFVDRQTSHRNRSIIKGIEPEQNKLNLNFKLIKNECIINGKMYKFTETFLLLIQMFQQYVRIYDSFPSLSQQVPSALGKLAGFYNEYAFKLIVQAGAVHFKKLKTKNITARHLAVSSLCLEFLLFLLDIISKKMKIYAYKDIVDNIISHHTQIANKLKAILQVKIKKSLPDVVLGVVPSTGTLSIINSAKALYDILSEFYTGAQYLSRIFNSQIFSRFLEHLSSVQINNLEKAETLKQEVSFFFGELQFLSKIVPQFSQMRAEGDNMIMRIFQSL